MKNKKVVVGTCEKCGKPVFANEKYLCDAERKNIAHEVCP